MEKCFDILLYFLRMRYGKKKTRLNIRPWHTLYGIINKCNNTEVVHNSWRDLNVVKVVRLLRCMIHSCGIVIWMGMKVKLEPTCTYLNK